MCLEDTERAQAGRVGSGPRAGGRLGRRPQTATPGIHEQITRGGVVLCGCRLCAVAWRVACGRLRRLGRLCRLRRLWRGRDLSDLRELSTQRFQSPAGMACSRLRSDWCGWGWGLRAVGTGSWGWSWELGVSGPSTRCWFRILRCQEDASLQCFCRAKLQPSASRCIHAGSRLLLAESTQVGTGSQVLGARLGTATTPTTALGRACPCTVDDLGARRIRHARGSGQWGRLSLPLPVVEEGGALWLWLWLCVVACVLHRACPQNANAQLSNQAIKPNKKQTPKRSALAAETRASGVWEISVNPAATLTRAATAATPARVPKLKPGNTIMQQSGRQVCTPSCACHEIGEF